MLHAIPFIALVMIFAASVLRGEAIRRKSGDRAWAFASSKGNQRLAGLAFAASIAVLAMAGAVVTKDGRGEFPDIAAMLSGVGAAIVIVAQIQMGRAWRVGVRHGDAPLFIRHGLFRFSRNPIFVGMMMIALRIVC